MLVLSRRYGESIIINKEIEVRVVSLVGGVVKLGITAPASVAIYRGELLERMHRDGQSFVEGRLARRLPVG